MARIVFAGDSQSVVPGGIAEEILRSAGHQTLRVSNTGKGPYDYVRMATLWSQYTQAVRSFNPSLVVLIFGSNDSPNQNLADALRRLKASVKPKVILSGPPRYPDAAQQKRGEKIRGIYVSAFGEDYFDSYPHTAESLSRAPDGLHFTRSGARPWGQALAAEVQRRLANL